MNKECLQVNHGPTPCFREVEETVCSLDFCPVSVVLDEGLAFSPWSALNGYCVMGDEYGSQSRFDEGTGEYIRALAELRNKN